MPKHRHIDFPFVPYFSLTSGSETLMVYSRITVQKYVLEARIVIPHGPIRGVQGQFWLSENYKKKQINS